jgi:hypothetical protein
MLEELKLSDLYNPRGIVELFHLKKQVWIVPTPEKQGFQEYPGSVELWEKLDDGRLLRVQRWLKTSVMVSNGDKFIEY